MAMDLNHRKSAIVSTTSSGSVFIGRNTVKKGNTREQVALTNVPSNKHELHNCPLVHERSYDVYVAALPNQYRSDVANIMYSTIMFFLYQVP
jgi:hypothetical protein